MSTYSEWPANADFQTGVLIGNPKAERDRTDNGEAGQKADL